LIASGTRLAEELLFGFQRLIAVREGPNVRRTFAGARFTDHLVVATVYLLLVRSVSNAIGVFDDHTNMKQLMWGGYLTVPLGPVLKADLYELNYENESAKYRGLTGVDQHQTFGVRLFGNADGLGWNAAAAMQSGTFRNEDIHAGYTLPTATWQPRIGIESNYASGDSGRGAIGTFNAMFPRLPYFVETSLWRLAGRSAEQPAADALKGQNGLSDQRTDNELKSSLQTVTPKRRVRPASFEPVKVQAQPQIIPEPSKHGVLIGEQRCFTRTTEASRDRPARRFTVAQRLDDPLCRDRIIGTGRIAYR
jgi:hypothetical protein